MLQACEKVDNRYYYGMSGKLIVQSDFVKVQIKFEYDLFDKCGDIIQSLKIWYVTQFLNADSQLGNVY